MLRFRIAIFLAVVGFALHSGAAAQSADGRSPIIPPKQGEEVDDRPKGIRETIEKLRIEKEKKEFDEMIGRGEEAVRISEELDDAYAKQGRLDNEQLSKIAAVEKLVKKIRSELGGGDDDRDTDNNKETSAPSARGEIIKTLRSTTTMLLDELKKTSRFTVSAAAIQTSNTVLRLARFLRITK